MHAVVYGNSLRRGSTSHKFRLKMNLDDKIIIVQEISFCPFLYLMFSWCDYGTFYENPVAYSIVCTIFVPLFVQAYRNYEQSLYTSGSINVYTEPAIAHHACSYNPRIDFYLPMQRQVSFLCIECINSLAATALCYRYDITQFLIPTLSQLL